MVKLSLGWLGLAPKKWNKGVNDFLTGTDEIRENVSTLRPEQEQGFQNLQNASNGRGAGGAAGEVADYYRNNLSDNPADQQAFAAPQMTIQRRDCSWNLRTVRWYGCRWII
jgi:hypothetical protein